MEIIFNYNTILRRKIDELLATKTGWGRNELKMELHKLIESAFAELYKERIKTK